MPKRLQLARATMNARLLSPMIVLPFVVIAAFWTVSKVLAHRFDTAAQAREETIVRHGFDNFAAEMAARVVPQTAWDEAVIHLDNRFDPSWARDNIGRFLNQASGFDTVFVLDDTDAPVFAATAGDPAPLAIYSAYDPDMQPVVARLRTLEADRGGAAAALRSDRMAPPLQVTSIVDRGDGAELVSATLVQPDFGHATLQHARAPIVIAAMRFDGAPLQSFTARYLLDDEHLHAGDARMEAGQAHVVLRDIRGRPAATIDWTPRRPAQDVMRTMRPVAILLLIAAALLFTLLYRRSRAFAEALISSETRATHQAHIHPLTGLPNRAALLDRLSTHIQRTGGQTEPASLILIDIARLQALSELNGQHASDELARVVAARLTQAALPAQTTIAHVLDDRFAVFTPCLSAPDAEKLARALADLVAQPAPLSATIYAGGAAGGVAAWAPGDTADAADYLRQAELAVSAAKRAGGVRVFTPELDRALEARRALERDLREALLRGELDVNYQPQVNRAGEIAGVEALVRWTHPTRGVVSPGVFIPIAEESALIVDIGDFVLRRAFADSQRWRSLPVAINVSAKQLQRPEFASEVLAMARAARVQPQRFELEITESVFLGDDDATQANVKSLRDAGFGIALDDFGTGYSTLSYLRRLPISKIKIDRSFITTLGVDSESDAVVVAIVRLAKALRLSVLAEGVETTQQRERLIALGCSDVQGFLFGKAVPANEISSVAAGLRPAAQAA